MYEKRTATVTLNFDTAPYNPGHLMVRKIQYLQGMFQNELTFFAWIKRK